MVSTATGCRPLHRTALSLDRLAVGEGRRNSLGGQSSAKGHVPSSDHTVEFYGRVFQEHAKTFRSVYMPPGLLLPSP